MATTMCTRGFHENGKMKEPEEVELCKSQEDWLKNPSSKLTALIWTWLHHSSQPGQGHFVPPMELVDVEGDCINFSRTAVDFKSMTFPHPPSSLGELLSDPRQLHHSPGVSVTATAGQFTFSTPRKRQPPVKGLLGYLWPKWKEPLKSVLAAHGIYAAWVDGGTKLEDRTRIFADFNKEELHLSDEGIPTGLLAISSVGTVGLNLSRGTYIFQIVSEVSGVMMLRAKLSYITGQAMGKGG